MIMVLRKIKFNKIILFSLILFSIILVLCFGLDYSTSFNNFIFSNIINPYNPAAGEVEVNKKATGNEYWEDPRGLFPIFAYSLPEKTKNLTSSLKIIEKGGINIVINGNYGWLADAEKVKEAFRQLKDTNLRWISLIGNECKDDFIYNNASDRTNGKIKNYLKRFNDNFVYGWYLWDEPGRNRKPCSPFDLVPNDDFSDINRMAKQIRSDTSYNNHLDFVNLFPMYWDQTPDKQAYENYIDAFISSQEYKPRLLCFDYYPLLKESSGGFRNDYYLNLSIIQKKSLEYNIPSWIIVLTSGHHHYKNPSFEEISFQVYSALAYGVKGIGYYLYSKSWEKHGYTSWVLENFADNDKVADSLHGKLFVSVKKINWEIQNLGKTLLKLEPVEVIHSSDYPNKQKDVAEQVLSADKPLIADRSDMLIRKIDNLSKINSDSRVLVGILSERENSENKGRYLLVVNKDIGNKIDAYIVLNKVSDIFRFDKNNGEKLYITKSDTLSAAILPGSGELFYVE